MEFLAKPHKLWLFERLEDKRAVLELTFPDRLAYVRNEGFRTEKTALSFSLLAEFSGCENRMAPRSRLERLTFPLGGGRSILLSYRGNGMMKMDFTIGIKRKASLDLLATKAELTGDRISGSCATNG